MKKVLSANEAVAHAAYAAGINVASSYPGTPSTEIMENLKQFPEIYAEWSVNEKVGCEVAIGASFAGARSMTTMKHVGLNVAMDPLMTFSYVDGNGGMVVVSADDPGMHSSQNEQDNRNVARFARIPMFEPSDSQEAYDMFRAAVSLSEEVKQPVLFRMTTRVCHSSGVVDLGDFRRAEPSGLRYEKNVTRTCPIPAFARQMRVRLEEKMKKLAAISEESPFNFEEIRDTRIGVVTSGVSYQYVREAMPQVSVLKLGFTNPIPREKIAAFAGKVDRLYVIEEGDKYLEEQILSMGISLAPHSDMLKIGELNPDRVADFYAEITGSAAPVRKAPAQDLPARPPVLCPGCSHRPVFYALNKLGCIVTGDIGCYSLGLMKPLDALDTIICMGGGITNAHGFEKGGETRPVVGIVGDSTFFHSGITGLVNMVYNKSHGTIIISDNRITAMTGHQDNPGTGSTLRGEPTSAVDLEALCKGIGVKRVRTINPYNIKETIDAIKEEIEAPELSVIISKYPCMLTGVKHNKTYFVDPDKCKACGMCIGLGCQAILRGEKTGNRYQAKIDPVLCAGCGMCSQLCKFGAIQEKSK
ncbi:MAG: indolepyruvate ferredoxin oxidoreductase subunit alpha [Abditibacteriota bacterium]|nr:indolepyruvate ferredoxin oxidoreductase subunit alpha [Abditibacteriota bacterium]